MAQVEFTDNSAKVLEELEKQTRACLQAWGETARGYAVDECPVETGLLRNSLAWAISGEAPDIKEYEDDDGEHRGAYDGVAPKEGSELAVYIGSNVKYAAVQEYGDFSHKVGKKHFLKDAIAKHQDKYREIMEAALSK